MGFSIKSEVGNAQTLLNAGKTTNFIYKVTGITTQQINAIDASTKIKDRIKAIKEFGGSICYEGMEHPRFKHNLIMVDSSMPQIIGNMLITMRKMLKSVINWLNLQGNVIRLDMGML